MKMLSTMLKSFDTLILLAASTSDTLFSAGSGLIVIPASTGVGIGLTSTNKTI